MQFATFVVVFLLLSASSAQLQSQAPFQKERILIGTVQNLASGADAAGTSDTSDTLAGFRLWVEQTNLQGGIKVGNRSMDVQLISYNAAGDLEKQRDLYQRLVEREGVDFLLGGGYGSTEAMIEAGNRTNVISMASAQDAEAPSIFHPLSFSVHHRNTHIPTLSFVQSIQQSWGISRIALIWNSDSADAAKECASISASLPTQDFTVVFEQEFAPGSQDDTMKQLAQSAPEVLISCVDDEGDAQQIILAAKSAHMLVAWNPDAASASAWCGSECVRPAYVESSVLKFMFFTAGVAEPSFGTASQGWAQRALGPALWHPTLTYADAHLGGTQAVNQRWRSRADFGDGENMPEAAAVAAASGVTLRLAIEKAGTTETEGVVEALRALHEETFFGHVRFGDGQSNVGLERPVVQWDCSGGRSCVRRARLPASALAAPEHAQPLLPACPMDEVRNDYGRLFREQYAPVENAQGLAFPPRYLDPPCTPCMRANMSWMADMTQQEETMESVLFKCQESFSHPNRYGVAMMAGPGDNDAVKGVQRITEVMKMIIPAMVQIEVVPVAAAQLQSADDSAKAAGRAALNTTVHKVKEMAPFGWMIWNDGLRQHLGADDLGLSCPGGGPQVTWGTRAVCMAPAVRLQGRALAQVVDHFGWKRVHVVVGAEAAYAEMLSELKLVVDVRNIAIASEVQVPAEEEGLSRVSALERVARLDDCEATIVLLLVGRGDAEAIFDMLSQGQAWGGDRRLVPIGSEAATRARNAPEGMLGVRTVAVAESDLATLVMLGEERAWGTGVPEPAATDVPVRPAAQFGIPAGVDTSGGGGPPPGVDISSGAGPPPGVDTSSGAGPPPGFGRRGGRWQETMRKMEGSSRRGGVEEVEGAWGAETEEVAPWQDIGVEDRMLFASDAALVIGWSVWWLLLNDGDVGSQEQVDMTLLGAGMAALGEGATGPFEFELAGDDGAASPRRLQRTAGRLALVNRQEHGWASLATLDVQGAGLLPVQHTVQESLGHSAWEQEAVFWGAGAAPDGGKPKDVCACVVWQKMGPHSRIRDCRWSVGAFVLTAVAVAGLAAGMVGCWWLRRKRYEASELLVMRRMKELRIKLRLRRRDGFILSNEHRGLYFCGRQPRVMQRKHLEAVARMTLLYDFDVRAVDALAWELLFGEVEQNHKFDGADRHLSRNASGSIIMETSTQYQELRTLVLETSRVLLDPSLDWAALAAKVGRATSPKDRRRRRDLRNDSFSLPRTMRQSVTGSLAWQHGNDAEGQSPIVGARGSQASNEGESAFPPSALSSLEMWQEDHHSLFKELKEGPVQHFMDELHAACDEMFSVMLGEPRGEDLVHFHFHSHHQRHRVASPSLDQDHNPAKEAESTVVNRALMPATLHPPASKEAPTAQEPGQDLVVARQDHDLVRAIRMSAEDWREATLERAASARAEPAEEEARQCKDEEVCITQLHRRAVLLNEEFQMRVQGAVERQFGGRVEFHSAPVKTKGRMREKLQTYASLTAHRSDSESDQEEDPNFDHLPLAAYILDPIRTTLVCEGAAEMLEVVDWLVKEGAAEGLSVVRVKNKFAAKDASEYDGYRDLMVSVLYTGSLHLNIIGEIQIHDRRLHALKLQMHKLYKVKRATKATHI